MKRVLRTSAGVSAGAVIALAAWGHDMFLVVPDHHLPPHSPVRVDLYNGTFDKSENTIDLDRMIDVSIVNGEGNVTHPTVAAWREEGEVTVLTFETGGPGTYLVGVSTRARMIELSAEDFNDYLKHDGVVDVLAEREAKGILADAANERYSKHVKTILQVGDDRTATFARRLGYPVEIVPLVNPTELAVGDSLNLLVLADGVPVAGQIVYASHQAFSAAGGEGVDQREAVTTRTDDTGTARVPISRSGRWYVRLIHMVAVDEPGVDYESNWATLTFEVRGDTRTTPARSLGRPQSPGRSPEQMSERRLVDTARGFFR